jgi:hypothetical protein
MRRIISSTFLMGKEEREVYLLFRLTDFLISLDIITCASIPSFYLDFIANHENGSNKKIVRSVFFDEE